MLKIVFLASVCACALFAQAAAPNASMVRFDVKAIDKTADPCKDFYQYACGNWMKSNPIPADQARWGRFSELDERNKHVLRAILEEAAKPDPGRDRVTRQIGDYFAACMDEKGIDARGLAPLKAEFDRIRATLGQVATGRRRSRTCIASAWHRCSNSAAGRTSRIPPPWWRSSIRAASACRTATTT